MLFKNKEKKEDMYLASCDVINLSKGYRTRVGDILLKNKKDAEAWMKDIHEKYIKDYNGNTLNNWKTVDYLCYKADGCEYYAAENKNNEFGEWTRHELWYRPIKFVDI